MKARDRVAALAACIALAAAPAAAGDWPSWRGPDHHGTSEETGLVSDWSTAGKNLIWRAEFIGRSTPVVLKGQACVIGRTGDGELKQEVVACYDARTGALRWEHRQNVYHTTVAFNRVGWASPAADPETGNLYTHGCAGQLTAFSPRGEILWEIFTAEEMGRLSGYGGRTQTPIVDGDKLIVTFVSSGWGRDAAPRHRYHAFDKRTGELLWVSTPGGMPFDMNTQSAPVIAEIGGRRLVVAGNADGHVYAVDVATGAKVWDFNLSRRGLNSTVLVAGDTVFASHSEENLDAATMGRLVAFRGTGTGDITDQELWRIDELTAGFPSPAYRDGKLYVVDNSAKLFRIDAGNGSIDWQYDLGTVGKASPVWANGKLFVPELNGRLHILRTTDRGADSASLVEVRMADGRYAEIYGSPAIAYGRIYLSTENGLFCIGDKRKPFQATDTTRVVEVPRGQGPPASLQVTPAEVRLGPGESVAFRARLFDALGRPLGEARKTAWELDGLSGKIGSGGKLTAPRDSRGQAGTVRAGAGELTGTARVRVIPPLPWNETFEGEAPGTVPVWWVGAKGKFVVQEVEGQKVLTKIARDRGLQRNGLFMGGDFSNYTIEADVRGGQIKRRRTDVGLLNSGYTLDLLGNHQRLEIRSWTAERRVAQALDFPWEMGVWYRMKFDVHARGDSGIARGKVWKRGEPEPESWTIEIEDPLPIRSGSPGLIGYSPADIHYDNIRVTVNP